MTEPTAHVDEKGGARALPEDSLKARRLMASIYPTRVERVLGWIVTRAYRLAPSERGPIDWIGDRADDLRCASQGRRARKGTHLRGTTHG